MPSKTENGWLCLRFVFYFFAVECVFRSADLRVGGWLAKKYNKKVILLERLRQGVQVLF